MKLQGPPWWVFVSGGVAFAAVALVARWLAAALDLEVGVAHGLLKGLLLVVALGAMALDGRGFSAYGFCRPLGVRWLWVVGVGTVLGAATTALILITPANGIEMMKRMTPLQIVLGVWLGSSLAEEVFFRGVVQGAVRPEARPTPGMIAALLFATLHLGQLFRGTDLWTVAILFVATLALGLVAGRLRQQSGSLLPALVVHIAFNLGGIPVALAAKLAAKFSS